jgi:hypothetical protein
MPGPTGEGVPSRDRTSLESRHARTHDRAGRRSRGSISENRHFVDRNTERFVQNPPGDLDALRPSPERRRSASPRARRSVVGGSRSSRGRSNPTSPRFETTGSIPKILKRSSGKVPNGIVTRTSGARRSASWRNRTRPPSPAAHRAGAAGTRDRLPRPPLPLRTALRDRLRKPRELILEAFQKSREVGTAERQRSERGRVDLASISSWSVRASARESWSSCDRAEVVQPSAPRRFECGSRCHCFATDERDGRYHALRTGAASRAASWAMLKRCRPMAPPRVSATARASRPPRPATPRRSGYQGRPRGPRPEHASEGAARRRTLDDAERWVRNMRTFSRTPCRVTGTAAHRSCMDDDITKRKPLVHLGSRSVVAAGIFDRTPATLMLLNRSCW